MGTARRCDGFCKGLQILTTHYSVGDGDTNQDGQLEGQEDLLATAFACSNSMRRRGQKFSSVLRGINILNQKKLYQLQRESNLLLCLTYGTTC